MCQYVSIYKNTCILTGFWLCLVVSEILHIYCIYNQTLNCHPKFRLKCCVYYIHANFDKTRLNQSPFTKSLNVIRCNTRP